MAVLAFTWHTHPEAPSRKSPVCEVCKSLEGYTWFFDTREGVGGLESGGLVHPQLGLVWSARKGSGEHGFHANCYCSIDYDEAQSDMSDLVEAARDLLNAMETAMVEGESKADEMKP